MGINLMLKFRSRPGDASEVRCARRIVFDGGGGLIIFNQENASCERLLLRQLHDLQIQPLPVWTERLAHHA